MNTEGNRKLIYAGLAMLAATAVCIFAPFSPEQRQTIFNEAMKYITGFFMGANAWEHGAKMIASVRAKKGGTDVNTG